MGKISRKTLKAHYLEEEKHPLGDALREIVFGMNDGLISTLGFIAGMSGAVIERRTILVAAIAELFAGMVSMSVGAYLSTKSQREYFEAEIERERREVETVPDLEREELRTIYRKKGLNEEEVEIIVRRLTSNKEQWVNTMMEEELRLFPERFEQPYTVAYLIGISFAVGSLIPIVPFVFLINPYSLFVSIAVSVGGLFALGAGKSTATGKNWVRSGVTMAVVGIAASAFCYLVGYGFSLLGG